MIILHDIGCRFPDCDCKVPDYAFSAENRVRYCKKWLDHVAENVRRAQENVCRN